MTTISGALAMAIRHRQAGRLAAAEQICRRILQAEPDHADALHLLGLLAHQLGRYAAAVDYLGRAAELRPQAAACQVNLAAAYGALGKLDEVVACCRRALAIDPNYAEAHNNLGNALRAQGKPEESMACYRRALELRPNSAQAQNNLGVALQDRGEGAEAIARFRRALELRPDFAEAHNNLANALKDQGKLDEAVACYRRALQLKPDYAEARFNLAGALGCQGKLDEAVQGYRRALELRPDYAAARSNLGNILQALGQHGEAMELFRQATGLQPDLAQAQVSLAQALLGQVELDEAAECCQRAFSVLPRCAELYNQLGNVRAAQGELDPAAACFRQALEIQPENVVAHSNLLLCEQYRPGVTPAHLAAVHALWDEQHPAPPRQAGRPRPHDHDPRRPLRLGFVSPDFASHPVGFFFVRTLESLRGANCHTLCYYNRMQQDGITARFQAAAGAWREVYGLSDDALAAQIRSDEVDMLFDLAGHTADNRLPVFARQPAPIQITWIGYEGTTGMAAMDYLIADRIMIPAGDERHYREKVLRLPDGYLCYDPPAEAPPVTPLPAGAGRAVTFASFNNPVKITPPVIEAWARILRRVPGARLVLKYRGLDRGRLRDRFQTGFAQQGIDPGRLELCGWSSYAEMLGQYGSVDLALDPFPFSGSATTCEALWMGVPVVTCPGETFAGRHSLSHLSNVGMTETIAQDLEEYVELAVSLANDLPRLATMRAGLREQMAASPLCDGNRFAANLMSILQDVWQQRLSAG
jgi:predicted O-linked N-acetylglucosamine transferase (SPINDLY family)